MTANSYSGVLAQQFYEISPNPDYGLGDIGQFLGRVNPGYRVVIMLKRCVMRDVSE